MSAIILELCEHFEPEGECIVCNSKRTRIQELLDEYEGDLDEDTNYY